MAFCFSVKKWFTLFFFCFFFQCLQASPQGVFCCTGVWLSLLQQHGSISWSPASDQSCCTGWLPTAIFKWVNWVCRIACITVAEKMAPKKSIHLLVTCIYPPPSVQPHQLLPNQHTTFAAPPMVLCLYINVCQQLFVVLIQVKEPQSIWLHDFSKWSKRSVLLALFLGLTASDQKLDSGKAWEWGYCVLIAYAAWLVAK